MKAHWLIPLVLTGCAVMDSRIATGERQLFAEMRGATPEYAIQRLGIPSAEQTIAGRRVFTWRYDEIDTLYCQFTAMLGLDGRIEHGQLTGSNGPCYNWLAQRGFPH